MIKMIDIQNGLNIENIRVLVRKEIHGRTNQKIQNIWIREAERQ